MRKRHSITLASLLDLLDLDFGSSAQLINLAEKRAQAAQQIDATKDFLSTIINCPEMEDDEAIKAEIEQSFDLARRAKRQYIKYMSRIISILIVIAGLVMLTVIGFQFVTFKSKISLTIAGSFASAVLLFSFLTIRDYAKKVRRANASYQENRNDACVCIAYHLLQCPNSERESLIHRYSELEEDLLPEAVRTLFNRGKGDNEAEDIEPVADIVGDWCVTKSRSIF